MVLVRRLRWSLFACLVITFSSPIFAEEAVQEIVRHRVDAFRKDKPFIALAVGAIVKGNSQLYFFGDLGSPDNRPNERTLFEIGSITKSMTGALLSVLVDEKMMELDHPANRYLPPHLKLPDAGGESIKLLHLATHTSEIPIQPPGIGLFAISKGTPTNPYKHYDHEQLTKTLKGLSIESHPGGRFQYSNLGMGMLGEALLAASQSQDFETLLQEKLFRPLGMSDSCIVLSKDAESRLATPHTAAGTVTSVWDLACLQGCGAVRSTPKDMMRWMSANLGDCNEPLRSSLAAAHRIRFPVDPNTNRNATQVGLAWIHVAIPNRSEKAVFHNGGTGGSRSLLAFVPGKQTGVLVLTNSAISADRLGMELLADLMAIP